MGDGTPEDLINATIDYYNLETPYIVSSPKSIEVTTSEGRKRYRETSIDNKGNITEIRQFLDEGTSANVNMTYDEYGNLETLTRPENHKGERLSFSFFYDDAVHTYTDSIIDGYGYSSTSSYEYLFGQMIENKDCLLYTSPSPRDS